ncbi:ATP-binding protein [Plantactinospora sp. KBS50]|uniref:ATP-binding protein n=1 Tax=Plantactinospora sp. KBS50 TaxID=2024580 RepID=UPI000BAB0AEE|nr:ATP-binding protein [Plantactinospora sp. KBS50]ASW57246.1 ATP-binding protein [Plantactinospora sp. KBS50]
MTCPAERAWCVVVPHQPRGARMARHRLSTELVDTIRPGFLADVVAVLAELVGNSVLHAQPLPGEVIRVAWRHHVEGDTDVVQVRVTDGGGAAPPQVRDTDLDSLDGRGLHIVTALATSWGADRDGLGQSVWAELRAPAGEPTAPPGGATAATDLLARR